MEAEWSAASDESRRSGAWIPNACETREYGKRCRFADECRSGFGSADVPPIGHVGLFPFNGSALRRLARKMGADAGTPGHLLRVALEEDWSRLGRISGMEPIPTAGPKTTSITGSSARLPLSSAASPENPAAACCAPTSSGATTSRSRVLRF